MTWKLWQKGDWDAEWDRLAFGVWWEIPILWKKIES